MLRYLTTTGQLFPSGFQYIPNFVTDVQKQQLLNVIMSYPWCSHLKRQQQYYGIKYFQTKFLDQYLQNKQSIGHFPLNHFQSMINKIKQELQIKSFILNPKSPNQVLVNKYLKNDALGFHVQDIHAFGQSILGLSLGSYDYLKLAPIDQFGHNKKGQISIKLEDKSIYVLEGISRYQWKHGIGRIHQGKSFKSENFMRISITFRDVIDTRRKL